MAYTEFKPARESEANLDLVTLAAAELVADSTRENLRYGNGALLGGRVIPGHRDIATLSFTTATAVSGSNALTLTVKRKTLTWPQAHVTWRQATNNTGPVTISLMDIHGTIGPQELRKNAGASQLAANDLQAGTWYWAIHNGSHFQLFPEPVQTTVWSLAQTFSAIGGSPTFSLPSNERVEILFDKLLADQSFGSGSQGGVTLELFIGGAWTVAGDWGGSVPVLCMTNPGLSDTAEVQYGGLTGTILIDNARAGSYKRVKIDTVASRGASTNNTILDNLYNVTLTGDATQARLIIGGTPVFASGSVVVRGRG